MSFYATGNHETSDNNDDLSHTTKSHRVRRAPMKSNIQDATNTLYVINPVLVRSDC